MHIFLDVLCWWSSWVFPCCVIIWEKYVRPHEYWCCFDSKQSETHTEKHVGAYNIRSRKLEIFLTEYVAWFAHTYSNHSLNFKLTLGFKISLKVLTNLSFSAFCPFDLFTLLENFSQVWNLVLHFDKDLRRFWFRNNKMMKINYKEVRNLQSCLKQSSMKN